jgi:hypothetical protein
MWYMKYSLFINLQVLKTPPKIRTHFVTDKKLNNYQSKNLPARKMKT